MSDNRSLVAYIEDALDATPFCGSCGAQTTILADEDRIVLACSAAQEPRRGLAGLFARLLPHERSVIVSGMA